MPVTVKLDADVHARVRELAKTQQRSPHYLMREAIAQYVDREEKRESLRQQALAAWSAYQVSGQHLPHDKAEDWLLQLEAGQDVDPPACQG